MTSRHAEVFRAFIRVLFGCLRPGELHEDSGIVQMLQSLASRSVQCLDTCFEEIAFDGLLCLREVENSTRLELVSGLPGVAERETMWSVLQRAARSLSVLSSVLLRLARDSCASNTPWSFRRRGRFTVTATRRSLRAVATWLLKAGRLDQETHVASSEFVGQAVEFSKHSQFIVDHVSHHARALGGWGETRDPVTEAVRDLVAFLRSNVALSSAQEASGQSGWLDFANQALLLEWARELNECEKSLTKDLLEEKVAPTPFPIYDPSYASADSDCFDYDEFDDVLNGGTREVTPSECVAGRTGIALPSLGSRAQSNATVRDRGNLHRHFDAMLLGRPLSTLPGASSNPEDESNEPVVVNCHNR
jgi:hypothetical protein